MNTVATRATHPTPVHVETTCDCPFSIAQEYAVQYLRRAESGGPEGRIEFPLPAPFPGIGRKVALSFGLATDETEDGRSHDEVRVHWSSGSRLFPNFRGTLRFRIAGGATLMIIDGAYDPPLGTAGAIFDRLVGHAVATSTLRNVADRLCKHLERSQRDWLVLHPAH